jgi:hypothetical protein
MKSLELLETYPKAGKVVNDWFLDKMLKSLNTDAIPEEFKEYISNQPIDNQNIAVMIDNNPRVLFDVFDENDIYIFIHYMDVKDNVEFFCSFRNIDTNPIKLFKTRKEAEFAAIEQAFKLLDEKL